MIDENIQDNIEIQQQILPKKEDLYKIYIELAGNIVHTIIAPRKAIDVFQYRTNDTNGIFYEPITIDGSWTEEKMSALEIDGQPGYINIYSDDVYYRLIDNNDSNCIKLRDRGNTKKSFFSKDMITKCNNDIKKLIINDNKLLKKWIDKLSEGENKIKEIKNKINERITIIEKKELEYNNLIHKEEQERNNYNNIKHMLDKIDQEEINFIIHYNNLRNSLNDSIIKLNIEKKGWNMNNIMDEFEKERQKYIKIEKKADEYKKQAEELLKKINQNKELYEKESNDFSGINLRLEEKGINLSKLKDDIQFQIDKYNNILYSRGGKKSKDRKSKDGKKK